MKLIVLLLFIVPAATLMAWEKYPGSEEAILGSDPVQVAKKAVEKGDFSLLMVADCFMGMPGYKGNAPPSIEPRVVGNTCEEMFGADAAGNLEALKKWAQQYNAYVQQHNNQLKSDAPNSRAP